jgi:hypothetical protein
MWGMAMGLAASQSHRRASQRGSAGRLMPKGHPRCPECHGAGGKMVRGVRGKTRWVRCKCVPSGRIDDSTKAQALNRLVEVFTHNPDDPVRQKLALDVIHFFGMSLEEVVAHLQHTLPYDVYNNSGAGDSVIAYYTDKEQDNGSH